MLDVVVGESEKETLSEQRKFLHNSVPSVIMLVLLMANVNKEEGEKSCLHTSER